jgi:SDR family mycofactocin-dependent oxidoreductase
MGTLDGKVAFISGIARGQGRSHALRLASEGADIIGIDICHDIASMDYPNATPADLAETTKLIEQLDRRVITSEADVRDAGAVRHAIDAGVAELGRLDIVLSNAGIVRLHADSDDQEQLWQDIVGTNLTGGFHVVNAAVPHLIAGGRGGSIVITGSTAGVRPVANPGVGALAYTASKWGLVGVCKQLAATLAEHSIRVNIVHPTGVASGMTMNAAMAELAEQAMAGGGANGMAAMQNAMPVQILQPSDISDAIAFLVSDQAKWITGVSLPVDAGFSVR